MTQTFFEKPILNSPYEYPRQHWELDETGQPTNRLSESRRRAELITPIPKPKKRNKAQTDLTFKDEQGPADEQQQYEITSSAINELRQYIDRWRVLPNPAHSNVNHGTRMCPDQNLQQAVGDSVRVVIQGVTGEPRR